MQATAATGSSVVRTERESEVAVIVVDNPPVNALSHAVRAGLQAALAAAQADTSVYAIVIASAGKTFIAGADITELGKPRPDPVTRTLTASLDDSRKPVIAAIHGNAMGGGLELALACHWRVAAMDARLGLPEVKLGLCPGAGGTQRLPRAVGTMRAVDMITKGEIIGATEAYLLSLVDERASGDVRAAAVTLARKVLAEKRPLQRLRDRIVQDVHSALFSRKHVHIARRSGGFVAPLRALEAIEAAVLPFDEGIAVERRVFAELESGPQFQALRHTFFAEREAAKPPSTTSAREIGRVAVIGAGTMGSGIATIIAQAGIPVTLIEADQAGLERGVNRVNAALSSFAKRRDLSAEELAKRQALVTPAVGLDAAAGADLVIEAVFEDLALKQRVFRELDHVAKPGAILASNTSYQDIDAIAAATQRPQDVLGLHFFSPVPAMRLVEVVRAAKTGDAALATGFALAKRCGKLPVTVGASPGFVGNRMLFHRAAAGDWLLQQGVSPRDIDRAMTDFGFPMGPFAASDLAGLDISWSMRKARGYRLAVADALCEAGRFGQKTGKGYYRYDANSRTPTPDPEAEAIIDRVRRELGNEKRNFSASGIVARMIYPLINEGARLLDERVAQRPGDIDAIWINGYGFPAWRGGPMFYADTIGARVLREALTRMAHESGDASLQPAPLIDRLAKEDGRFFAAR